ncbi:MAG TPA: DMT family transporter [Ktedonobacterales bacterium]|jgi:drug/metabolite transporter (DMT)-like permease|nr:DMT family transporter [Ktedonobacterales bacterium]
MNPIYATVAFGLAASLCWGSGDFSGGLASRRANPSSVVVSGYAVGFVLLVVLALIWREPLPGPADILWGGLAGIAGVLGLIAFYTALASGKMGIAAPVSAALTATLPVLFSAITAGLPRPLQLIGFVLALAAIWLISRPERAGGSGSPTGIGLALLAGCGFGCFFILISRVGPASIFWPLALARFTSVALLLIIMRLRRQRILPEVNKVPWLVVLAGTLDALGNAFFVLAAHSGRLDVAAILSSLYPAATVLLAAIVLRERVTRIQGTGILLVLLAIPVISAQI